MIMLFDAVQLFNLMNVNAHAEMSPIIVTNITTLISLNLSSENVNMALDQLPNKCVTFSFTAD